MIGAWEGLGLPWVGTSLSSGRNIRDPSGRIRPALMAREVLTSVVDGRVLAHLAADLRVDLIHSHCVWVHPAAAIAGRLSRRPVVVHLHDEAIPGVAQKIRGANVWLATWTIAVSDAVGVALPSWARHRMTVIRHGVDPDVFHPGPRDPVLRAELAAHPDEPVVLVVSRLDPTKGVDEVISAVGLLPPDLGATQLAIVGSERADPLYAASVRTAGHRLLGPRVRFLGQRDDVPSLLRASDVLVVGSNHEGLGLVILEAQASGTPVVAHAVGGVPELIKDDETGLLAGAPDAAHLSSRLAGLLRDPQLRSRIASVARSRALEMHTIDREADEEAALLAGLVGRPVRERQR